MWHEARRREKATQKLLSDHKKRAERRREENKVDASSLLQINGLKAKLHLDPSVYKQATNSLVPWQGDKNITIDRFDVRATLSSIPSTDEAIKNNGLSAASSTGIKNATVIDASESPNMKKLLNYERYRLLIHNDCNKTSEDVRLRLVARSDVLSDAKMRKLKHNTFGTLGEASIQESSFLSHESKYNNQVKRITNSGFAYSSVPPPQSLLSSSRGEIVAGESQEESDRFSKPIMDLDEFGNFDLDQMNLEGVEAGRIQEVAARFNLKSEELDLLVKNDDQDVDYKQTLNLLDQLEQRHRNKEKSLELTNRLAHKFYGPALPPEMVADQHKSAFSPDGDSNQDSTDPVRLRSPSGGSIPLRHTSISSPGSPEESNLASELPTRCNPDKTILSNNLNKIQVEKAQPSVSEYDGGTSSRLKEPVLESVLQKISQVSQKRYLTKAMEPQVLNQPNTPPPPAAMATNIKPEYPPRRASTPLIYRKNCRSSRSLSRERGYYRSRRRHSSSRSRSPSSLSTPTSSSASRSGYHSRRRSRSPRTSSCSSVYSPRMRSSRQQRRPPGRSKRRRRRRRNRRR